MLPRLLESAGFKLRVTLSSEKACKITEEMITLQLIRLVEWCLFKSQCILSFSVWKVMGVGVLWMLSGRTSDRPNTKVT